MIRKGAVLGVVVGAFALVAPAGATFPGVNGKIAWSSDRVAPADIWIANADGSNPVNLSAASDAYDVEPSFSPDGRQIVFSRDGALMIMNSDGTGAREVSTQGIDMSLFSGPVFSADGTRIVFEGKTGSNDDIYSVNISGPGDLRNLTPDIAAQDLNPAVAPDGNRIAFMSYRDGNAEIFTAGVSGASPHNLSMRPGIDHMPDISPDSSRVIWAASSPDHIFERSIGGGALAPIIPNPPGFESAPIFSPDGARRAFVTGALGGDADIVVAEPNGQIVANVSEPGIGGVSSDLSPTWAVAVDTPRTLMLSRKGRKRVKGTVASGEPGCVAETPVTVFRKRKGKDKRLGKTRTDAAGAFKLKRRKPLEGKVYAAIEREERSGIAICLGAHSPTVKTDK